MVTSPSCASHLFVIETYHSAGLCFLIQMGSYQLIGHTLTWMEIYYRKYWDSVIDFHQHVIVSNRFCHLIWTGSYQPISATMKVVKNSLQKTENVLLINRSLYNCFTVFVSRSVALMQSIFHDSTLSFGYYCWKRNIFSRYLYLKHEWRTGTANLSVVFLHICARLSSEYDSICWNMLKLKTVMFFSHDGV